MGGSDGASLAEAEAGNIDNIDINHAELKGLLTNSHGNDCIPWYPCARKYSQRELLADAVVLALGSIFSILATPLLLWHAMMHGGEALKQVGLGVYCMGLCSMLNCSLMFNRYCWREDWFSHLQFFDMVGIYFMVAGCYTPACFQSYCFLLFATTWSLAAVGVLWQGCNFGVPSAKRYPVDITLFLIMGWVIVVFRHQVTPYVSSWAGRHVLSFGIIFTIGAGFNMWESLEFHKAIWHVCVLVGTILTYIVAYREFADGLPLGTKLVVGT